MQLLTETLVVALGAGVLGAVLAAATLATIGATVGEQLGAGVPGGAGQLPLGLGSLALAAGVGALVGVAFGLLPALSATGRHEAAGTSFGDRRGSASAVASPVLRRGLIVVQVAFTMMLLVGAGLMARTMVAIGNARLGFEPDGVVKGTLLLPLGSYPDAAARREGIARLLAGVGSAPGVRGVAIATPHLYRTPGPGRVPVTAEGRQFLGDLGPRAAQYVVSDGFFETMRIPVRGGRTFSTVDAQSAPAVVVSEELASEVWPGENPIGRRLRLDTDTIWRTVIGVVGDTRESVDADQEPDVYLPFTQVTRAFVSLLVRVDGDPAAAGMQLRRVVGRVSDVLALSSVEPLTDVVVRDSRRQRALAAVLTTLGLLALGIAMLGLYASLSYVVAQRRREIAIRVAVGASAARIRRLVAAEGAAVVGLGIGIGVVLSVALTRVLGTLLHEIEPTDPITFVGIAIVLGAAGLGAALSPARQAARVQPAEILRGE
jgi:putative ABC transport system permease protein